MHFQTAAMQKLVQIELVESSVVATIPRTGEFAIRYVSITIISELENNRTNLVGSELCVFICRFRPEFLLSTLPQI